LEDLLIDSKRLCEARNKKMVTRSLRVNRFGSGSALMNLKSKYPPPESNSNLKAKNFLFGINLNKFLLMLQS